MASDKLTGYPVLKFDVPTKRYVRTLTLRNDPELIAAYRLRHSKGQIWPEIIEGLRAVGVLEMEIYIHGNLLVMIVEAPADVDWEEAMSRVACMPRQQEWEDFMAVFQQAAPGVSGGEKWTGMERMFHFWDDND